MKCRIFGHLKKTTLLLLAALLSFLPLLSGVLSESVFAESIPVPTGNSISFYNLTAGTGQAFSTGSYNFWSWNEIADTTNDGVAAFTDMCFSSPSSITGKTADGYLYFNFNFSIVVHTTGSNAWPIISNGIVSASSPFVVTNDSLVSTTYEMPIQSGTTGDSASKTVSYVYNHNVIGYVNEGATIPNNICFYGNFLLASFQPYADGEFQFTQGKLSFYQDQGSSEQQQLEDINNNIQEQTQQQQEYHDEAVDASNNAGDVSDSQGQQAESSGTTLLSAFTSFVGAVTSASPTSCVISGDLGIGGFSVGNLDLCSFEPPAFVQVLSSLILIGTLVPISIFTARKMINLFRSFTNG